MNFFPPFIKFIWMNQVWTLEKIICLTWTRQTVLEIMEKTWEVGRQQGCEVGARVRKMHLQGRPPELSQRTPRVGRTYVCRGKSWSLPQGVLRQLAGKLKAVSSGLWHAASMGGTLGGKGRELLVCGPLREALQRKGAG